MTLPTKTSLADHIAALRAKQEVEPKQADNAMIFWGTSADTPFLPMLKPCAGAVTVYLRSEPITTVATVQMACRAKMVSRVLSTSIPLLAKLLHWEKRAAPSLDNYAGSLFTVPASAVCPYPIEIVFLSPLKQLATVPYGAFITKRLITKLSSPAKWYKPTEFTGFELITPANEAANFAILNTCFIISIDIETLRDNATIRCLSYTGVYKVEEELKSHSVVLALDSEYALAIMRKWNWELKAPKCFQNGKYDIAYFTRYSAPVYNYLYDTAHLFHCWYSELPKDLGFLNTFFIREAAYWKDLADTNDLYTYYKYNAMDTWGTVNCFLAMIAEAPKYALDNYLLEFPLVFPCHLSEMTGIARDMGRLKAAKKEQEDIVTIQMASLNAMLAIPKGQTFNVMSSPQMKQLLTILGCSDLPSADAKSLDKARFRHPFNARIINAVLKVRKARKNISTYLTEGNEFCGPDGTGNRILYSLNPHGTDTGRLASREHAFWCGINMQNVPRGKIVKQTFKADNGFYLAECDLEQAESRDTAYISGDEVLIHNVEFSPDFHSANASAFFGVPFDKIFDVTTGKVIDKDLRTLAKPVNHGANYNMGPSVLIATMGEENIVKAKQLLKLPTNWDYMAVASHLLEAFHNTYKDIKGVFYAGVVNEILTTSLLVNKAVHWSNSIDKEEARSLIHTMNSDYLAAVDNYPRWTRYCFGRPDKSKQQLNSYIAHPPQSLNAQTLNKAYLSIFNDIAMHPELGKHFKLCAQIHDSILFQYRIGHDYLCDMVQAKMEIPLTIRAYDNKVRTFIVPAGVKKGQHLEGDRKNHALYWSETE